MTEKVADLHYSAFVERNGMKCQLNSTAVIPSIKFSTPFNTPSKKWQYWLIVEKGGTKIRYRCRLISQLVYKFSVLRTCGREGKGNTFHLFSPFLSFPLFHILLYLC